MDAHAFCTCFDTCFAHTDIPLADRACLVRGGEEPLFLPPSDKRPLGEIIYARDLVQSAVHEVAHWLYAGSERRLQEDWGYWYIPDGRNAEQQSRFEDHEWPVQGLECVIAYVADIPFVISADNLDRPDPSPAFKKRIAERAYSLLETGLPKRAARLCAELQKYTKKAFPSRADIDQMVFA